MCLCAILQAELLVHVQGQNVTQRSHVLQALKCVADFETRFHYLMIEEGEKGFLLKQSNGPHQQEPSLDVQAS